MAESNRAFGERLRRARRATGLTQEGLAERAGLSSRLISDLERGLIRAPRRDTLEMLLEALDTPAEQQLFRQLSVFVGGWKLPVAKAVCCGDDVLDISRLPREDILRSLDSVAIIAMMRVDTTLAARLFGAADALRAAMRIRLAQPDQQRRFHYLTECRSSLDEADWQQAWNAGQALSLTQATTLAHDALARW